MKKQKIMEFHIAIIVSCHVKGPSETFPGHRLETLETLETQRKCDNRKGDSTRAVTLLHHGYCVFIHKTRTIKRKNT